MGLAALLDVLGTVPPLELKGMRLMQAHVPPPGAWFPRGVPLKDVVDATQELLAYTTACGQIVRQLEPLLPVPLRRPALVEYVL
jgi:hypothetical protein